VVGTNLIYRILCFKVPKFPRSHSARNSLKKIAAIAERVMKFYKWVCSLSYCCYHLQLNIYGYVPSLAAAAAALALFAIVTAIHVVYVFRYRIWYFLPIIIGGMLEVGGFAARIISRNEPGALGHTLSRISFSSYLPPCLQRPFT